MGTSGASEPLNFFIIVFIYDLLIVVSSFFMTVPLKMVALTTSRIYLMIYLIDITNIDTCDLAGQQFKFLSKLIGCEAHEVAE